MPSQKTPPVPYSPIGSRMPDVKELASKIDSHESKLYRLDQTVQNQSSSIHDLNESVAKITVSFPFFVGKLEELVEDFKDFKERSLEQQLGFWRQQHEKEIQKTKETTETNTKVRLLWGIIGAVVSAAIAILIKLYNLRM